MPEPAYGVRVISVPYTLENPRVVYRREDTGEIIAIADPAIERSTQMPISPDVIAIKWGNNFYHPLCANIRNLARRCGYCGWTHDAPLVDISIGAGRGQTLSNCRECGKPGHIFWKEVKRGEEFLYQPSCLACRNDIEGVTIKSYIPSYNRRFSYKFNKLRTFGIEIECIINDNESRAEIEDRLRREGIPVIDLERYAHSDAATDQWVMKYDGSLRDDSGSMESWRSLEIVTPVMCGEESFNQIDDVLGILHEYCKVNRSCGLHVHHGAVDFSPVDLVKLYQLCYTDQNIIRSILPEHRRNNHYCNPLRHLHNPNRLAVIQNWGSAGPNPGRVADQLAAYAGRASVNFCSYAIRGTVEFRSHQGTLNETRIRDWVYLTQALMEKARSTVSSFYRVYRQTPADSEGALRFLLHQRLGFPMATSNMEGRVARSLQARRLDIQRGATA